MTRLIATDSNHRSATNGTIASGNMIELNDLRYRLVLYENTTYTINYLQLKMLGMKIERVLKNV